MAFYSSISPKALLSPAARQPGQSGGSELVATLEPGVARDMTTKEQRALLL
jgi:hypothetical protein